MVDSLCKFLPKEQNLRKVIQGWMFIFLFHRQRVTDSNSSFAISAEEATGIVNSNPESGEPRPVDPYGKKSRSEYTILKYARSSPLFTFTITYFVSVNKWHYITVNPMGQS